MARTIRNEPPRWYRKENRVARRLTVRKHRHESNQALRAGNELPTFRGTEGRLTH